MRQVIENGAREHLGQRLGSGDVQGGHAGIVHMRDAVPKVEFETRAQWQRESRAKSRWWGGMEEQKGHVLPPLLHSCVAFTTFPCPLAHSLSSPPSKHLTTADTAAAPSSLHTTSCTRTQHALSTGPIARSRNAPTPPPPASLPQSIVELYMQTE
jgi:hypothetical protein